jgi:hypothetical protein
MRGLGDGQTWSFAGGAGNLGTLSEMRQAGTRFERFDWGESGGAKEKEGLTAETQRTQRFGGEGSVSKMKALRPGCGRMTFSDDWWTAL